MDTLRTSIHIYSYIYILTLSEPRFTLAPIFMSGRVELAHSS